MRLLLMLAGAILAVAAITTIAYLTLSILKKFRKKTDSTIIAADMKELLKEAKKNPNAKRMSFDELKRRCKETTIIYAEYDEKKDKVVQIQGARDAERAIKDLLDESGVLRISD